MSKIIYLTDASIIVCVVPNSGDRAEKMLLAAREAGANASYGFNARGYGARERLGALSVAVETEKHVFNVLVSSEQLEIVFEAMYRAGELDQPGAGWMYVTPVEKLATFVPESIAQKAKNLAASRREQ
jgi:nitrogen regulatory protein PII